MSRARPQLRQLAGDVAGDVFDYLFLLVEDGPVNRALVTLVRVVEVIGRAWK